MAVAIVAIASEAAAAASRRCSAVALKIVCRQYHPADHAGADHVGR